MNGDGTVVLIVSDPGDGTPFGHGQTGFRTWWRPQSGHWLMRCSVEAAQHFCLRAGCYMAPDELQNADR